MMPLLRHIIIDIDAAMPLRLTLLLFTPLRHAICCHYDADDADEADADAILMPIRQR